MFEMLALGAISNSRREIDKNCGEIAACLGGAVARVPIGAAWHFFDQLLLPINLRRLYWMLETSSRLLKRLRSLTLRGFGVNISC